MRKFEKKAKLLIWANVASRSKKLEIVLIKTNPSSYTIISHETDSAGSSQFSSTRSIADQWSDNESRVFLKSFEKFVSPLELLAYNPHIFNYYFFVNIGSAI